jgi:hypothetical protein
MTDVEVKVPFGREASKHTNVARLKRDYAILEVSMNE